MGSSSSTTRLLALQAFRSAAVTQAGASQAFGKLLKVSRVHRLCCCLIGYLFVRLNFWVFEFLNV